jgi:site-specific recombinase XerD
MSHNILHRLKKEFLEYLEIEKGRSLKTIESYRRYLDRFLKFSKVDRPEKITDSVIREYRLWLNRQTLPKNTHESNHVTLKKKTQNYHLIALRSFLKYLMRREISSLSPERIELAKTPERALELISNEELMRLLEAPEGNSERSLRDRAILELLFSTGLRVSELCSLTRDIDLRKSELSVRGKGEKIRVVFLSPKARDAIGSYLAGRKDLDNALFVRIAKKAPAPRMDNLGLTPRSIERIVKHYAIKAGISKKVTPHTIRHSFATDLLQNGADLRSVQALLGHANIATTQIYTHITDKHLREVHQAFHGRQRK